MAKATDEHTATDWSVDDAYQYLTQVVDLQDDLAIDELNQKFKQGRLKLHYRRTDDAGLGQGGIVPAVSWQSGALRVSRDFNRNEIDWASGKITAQNDGRAFVAICEPEDSGHAYELTMPERIVRMLWPPRSQVEQKVEPTELKECAAKAKLKTATSCWIEVRARRLKAAGKISGPIRITDFAKLLESEMRTAAKTDKNLRPVGWEHIKNHLSAWGLWPISSIK